MNELCESQLVDVSRRALGDNQTDYGSFMASPDFSQYPFCWLRDSAFIVVACDRVGEHQRSAAFHNWTFKALEGIRTNIHRAIELHSSSRPLERCELPPCRFGLDGGVVGDDWPNFQVDGYGLWLWALESHLQSTGTTLTAGQLEIVELTAAFVSEFATQPCFDVWEMFEQGVHTSTLAGVAAGLASAGRILSHPDLLQRCAEVTEVAVRLGAGQGRLVKSSLSADPDASTLWLFQPLGLLASGGDLMQATVQAVERDLLLDGGVSRFPEDTYYGGGAWPVLSATLGLCHLAAGNLERATDCLTWIESHFAGDLLAEQFGGDTKNPQMYNWWVNEWGVPAQQLTWSHAMHLLLHESIKDQLQSSPDIQDRVVSPVFPSASINTIK